jgi:hypothetical protein
VQNKEMTMQGTNEKGLLELLWNDSGDTIPGGGDWTDKFIGLDKILCTGTMDVQNDKFEAIEFSAVITLGKRVPRAVSKPA